MNIVPSKDRPEWAAYNSRFSRLLVRTPTICFILVIAGSVYGIQKSIESQHPGVGIIMAIGVAFLVQSINSVSVHYSTRWIASLFMRATVAGRSMLRANKHQRVALIDGVVGLLCIAFTCSICYFDFRANKEGSERAADSLVAKPTLSSVDTTVHAAAIFAARQSVAAAKESEASERRAWEARVDRDINSQRARYAARQAHLNGIRPLPRWAASEIAQIRGILSSLENTRRARKAEFVPAKSNVAEAQNALSSISAENSRLLLSKQIRVDSTNAVGETRYESKKEGFTMAMFYLYIAAMLLWHLCHAMKQYRALRFDEQHPDNDSAIVAIFDTVKNGVSNALWRVKAKIMEWMPEDEIHGITRTDLLAKTNTALCGEVYRFVLENPGVNEMLIYTSFRGKFDPVDIRQSLRLLKTSKLVFENSHTWTADGNQAAFFAGSKQSAPFQ